MSTRTLEVCDGEHTFRQLDDVTIECVECGVHWSPRIRFTDATSRTLLEAIDTYGSELWVARRNAQEAGEPTTDYNHKRGQLKKLRRQIVETRERFGWDPLESSSET